MQKRFLTKVFGIFQGKNNFERECISIVILPSRIYLGTKAGLFVSLDNGRSWRKEAAELGKAPVFAIGYNTKEPDSVYVVCLKGVFKTKDSGQSWEKTFVAFAAENDDDKQEVNDDTDEELRFSSIV